MGEEIANAGYGPTCDILVHMHVLTEEEMHREGQDDSPESKSQRRFKHSHLVYASPYVAALAARYLTESVRRSCAWFLLTQHGDISMASASGYQFERLVHGTLPFIPRGHALKLKLLPSEEEFTIELPRAKPVVFSTPSDAAMKSKADCSVYLMPASTKFPAIDCMMSRKLLFQVRHVFSMFFKDGV